MLALTPLAAIIIGVILLFGVGVVLRMTFDLVRNARDLTSRIETARVAIQRAAGEVRGEAAETERRRAELRSRRKDRGGSAAK